MAANTIRLHRVLRTIPEKAYRTFLDGDAGAKWLPPNGFTGKVHHMDAKVGGIHKISFTNFSTGKSHSFGGEYIELLPQERHPRPDSASAAATFRKDPVERFDYRSDYLTKSVPGS